MDGVYSVGGYYFNFDIMVARAHNSFNLTGPFSIAWKDGKIHFCSTKDGSVEDPFFSGWGGDMSARFQAQLDEAYVHYLAEKHLLERDSDDDNR